MASKELAIVSCSAVLGGANVDGGGADGGADGRGGGADGSGGGADGSGGGGGEAPAHAA